MCGLGQWQEYDDDEDESRDEMRPNASYGQRPSRTGSAQHTVPRPLDEPYATLLLLPFNAHAMAMEAMMAIEGHEGWFVFRCPLLSFSIGSAV